MKKRLLFPVLLFSLFLFPPPPAFAGSNLFVFCHPLGGKGKCQIRPKKPLFSEENVQPGQTYEQTLTISNQSPKETCYFYLSASSSDEPPQHRFIENKLLRQGETVYTANLADFFGLSAFIETIPPKSTYTYLWQAYLDPQMGNNLQGQTINFDLYFNFTCDASQLESLSLADSQVLGTTSNLSEEKINNETNGDTGSETKDNFFEKTKETLADFFRKIKEALIDLFSL